MTRARKMLFVLVSLSFAPMLLAQERAECYSIVAGRKATADGSVLLGHNEDNGRHDVAGLYRVPREQHKPGEWVKLPGGGRLAQVETTFSFLYLQMPKKAHSDALLNEHGVAVVSNSCPSREDRKDFTDGGIGGPVLRRLVAERARSAREGVRLVGALVERFGYTASGRTLVIADPMEGWQVALVRGRHWAAARVPDDEVALLANTYSIRELDLSDPDHFLACADLVDYAVERGWHDPAAGPFEFEKAYSARRTRVAPGNTLRQWSGTALLAAKIPSLPKVKRLPFSVKPKAPLKVADFTRVLRDHYEEASFRHQGHDGNGSYVVHGNTICRRATNSSSVFQLRSGMPVEIGALWWCAYWQPCTSLYVPIYQGIDAVPQALRFGYAADRMIYGQAYRAFRKLLAWVAQDAQTRHGDVAALWTSYERASFDYQATFEKHLMSLWKRDPAQARALMGRHTHGVVSQALEEPLLKRADKAVQLK